MIEIRAYADGYFIKVGNEVYQLDEESVIGGENWKVPLQDPPPLENIRLISKLSFAKVGDKATKEVQDSLPQESVIANGRTMLIKDKRGKWKRWDLREAGAYLPNGDEWIVAVVGSPF